MAKAVPFDPNEKKTKKVPETETLNPIKDIVDNNAKVQQDDTGYIPIFDLPTKGKLYPEGTIIKARSMKVMEVKALSQMNSQNANIIVNDVLRKCVRGIDISELYTADKMFLIFWLRANTYADSGFSIGFTCGKCEKASTYDFKLSNLKTQDFEQERHNKFKAGIETPGGHKLTLKLLQTKDEEETETFLRENETTMMDFDEDVVSLTKMIVNINGEKLGTIAKYRFLTETINPIDYTHIQSFIEEHGMGIQPTIDVECNKCGGNTVTVLPFRGDFFLPKVRT